MWQIGETTAIVVRPVNIPVNLSINFHIFCNDHRTIVTCLPKQYLPRQTPPVPAGFLLMLYFSYR